MTLAIKLHSQFIRAREKARVAYKETLERALTNIVMYLDVLRPRNFESPELTTELPMDVTYEFCYTEFEANAQEASKLMIKDIRTTTAGLRNCKRNLDIMFRLLSKVLSLHTEVATVRNTNSAASKVKRGLPGFNELGMTVEVSISIIMNRLMEVICMKDAARLSDSALSS